MLIQKIAVPTQAWQLGAGTAMEADLLAQGKIKLRAGGEYELFSQEATGKTGQIARRGDYFKVDSAGFPYPNSRAYFESMHEKTGDGWYLQKTPPLTAWTADEPMPEEIRYLLDRQLLQIHPGEESRFFSAILWGAPETAARDAVILIYRTDRNEQGGITGVDFNFVAKAEFDRTYRVLA